EERVVGGRVRDVQRRALGGGHVGGQRVDLGALAEAELGVGAGEGAAHVDAIGGFQVGDAGADRFHDSCRVGAGRVGQLRPAVVDVRAKVGVHRVHADGVGADEHLVGAGLGRGDLHELQDG